jgi:hypothetical protein
MTIAYRKETHSHSLLEAIQARIAEHLYHAYRDEDSMLGNLDRWTQQRITDENLAKVALVLNADEPAEACYRDLVREIDTEAEAGIFLVREGTKQDHLKFVSDEPGVSGELHRAIGTIAPVVFPDETMRSNSDLDLVWITIEAIHERAQLDASVSEIIMSFLMDDADSVHDITSVIRALMYTSHEDKVRRHCDLEALLGDTERRELQIMVSELIMRSGNYDDRTGEIRRKADTLYRSS